MLSARTEQHVMMRARSDAKRDLEFRSHRVRLLSTCFCVLPRAWPFFLELVARTQPNGRRTGELLARDADCVELGIILGVFLRCFRMLLRTLFTMS